MTHTLTAAKLDHVRALLAGLPACAFPLRVGHCGEALSVDFWFAGGTQVFIYTDTRELWLESATGAELAAIERRAEEWAGAHAYEMTHGRPLR